MAGHFARRENRCHPGPHRPGCGGSTPPSRRVGLQALQRCSGLLNRRARGSTVATHHFADVAQQRQQQFRKLPGAFAPRECESLHRLQFRGRNGRLKNSGEVCWASSLIENSAFCGPPSNFCSRGTIISAPRFERGGCRRNSCRECHLYLRSTIYRFGFGFCRVSPTTRGAPLRTERLWVELPHAAPFRPRSPTQRQLT